MPAKPLTPEQKADADRLNDEFLRFKRKGLTQASLADDLRFSNQSAVSQYLKGKIPLNIDAAIKFSVRFGCPVSKFSPSIQQEIDRISAHSDVNGSRVVSKSSKLIHEITFALDKARNILIQVSGEEPHQNKDLARVNAILTRIEAGELRSTEAPANEKQEEKVPTRLQPLFARLISLKDNESLLSAIEGMIAAVDGKQATKDSGKSIKPETNTSQRDKNHSSEGPNSIIVDDIMHPQRQIDRPDK